MASKRIQEIVDRFVTELVAVSEEEAAEALQDRLRDMLGGAVKTESLLPAKRRKTTKGYTVLRPCPIPGCKKVAAPRYQMVCKDHSTELSREEILVARDNAQKEGGVWFGLTPGKPWKGLKAAQAAEARAKAG